MDQETRGARIRRAREAVGLTGAEFARRVGAAVHTIWRLEHDRGSPGAGLLLRMAKVCAVDAEWIWDGTGRGPGGVVPGKDEHAAA